MPITTLTDKPIDSSGSVLEFDKDGTPTYVRLPGLDVIPEIGTNDQYEDDTDIDQETRSHMKKAVPELQELELVLKDMPGDADQKIFTDFVIGRDEIPCRVTRSSGRVQSFTYVPQNHKAGESAQGGKQLFACIGLIKELTDTLVA